MSKLKLSSRHLSNNSEALRSPRECHIEVLPALGRIVHDFLGFYKHYVVIFQPFDFCHVVGVNVGGESVGVLGAQGVDKR